MKAKNKTKNETLDLELSENPVETPSATADKEEDASDNNAKLSAGGMSRLAELMADAIARRLQPILIMHARLCAADTVRTCQRPDTVFRNAIKEAEIASAEIAKISQVNT